MKQLLVCRNECYIMGHQQFLSDIDFHFSIPFFRRRSKLSRIIGKSYDMYMNEPMDIF